MKSDKYGERRGAAFGLAGVVKGFRISCLKKYNVMTALRDGLSDRSVSMSCFRCFVLQTFGRILVTL